MKTLRFRTGLVRVSSLNYAKVLFDEDGNMYDETCAGRYDNCTVAVGQVIYKNCKVEIFSKESIFQEKYAMQIKAYREDGKPLVLVKLRDSGYSIWRITFPEENTLEKTN